jgi:hypothetical protein
LLTGPPRTDDERLVALARFIAIREPSQAVRVNVQGEDAFARPPTTLAATPAHDAAELEPAPSDAPAPATGAPSHRRSLLGPGLVMGSGIAMIGVGAYLSYTAGSSPPAPGAQPRDYSPTGIALLAGGVVTLGIGMYLALPDRPTTPASARTATARRRGTLGVAPLDRGGALVLAGTF